MRILIAVLAASLGLALAPAAFALSGDPPAKEEGRVGDPGDTTANAGTGRETLPGAPEQTRAQKLDSLFETLRSAPSEEAALAAEDSIAALWMDSGSATVDVLMEWALDAVKDKNYPLALDYLDRILTLKPDYVEAWNMRATVYYLREDFGRALADIEKTLALEPRHFVALAGLGTILREIGEDKRALDVYRRALEVDPHLPNVQKAIDDLTDKGVDGHDI